MMSRKSRALLGLACTIVLWAYIALGAIDGMVWMPMATAPGYSLDEIHAALEAAGEGNGDVVVIVWAVLWGLVALAPAVLGFMKSGTFANPRAMVILSLLVGGGSAFFNWFATFSTGNGISDTLPPYGGANSAFWPYYTAIAVAMFLLALVLPLAWRPRAVEVAEA